MIQEDPASGIQEDPWGGCKRKRNDMELSIDPNQKDAAKSMVG